MDKFELAKAEFISIKPSFDSIYVDAFKCLQKITKKSTQQWVVELEKRKFIFYVKKIKEN